MTVELNLEQPSAEQIAKHFSALGDSVTLINDIIAGAEAYETLTTEEKKDTVQRNVDHLELMKAKDFWTTESFTAVDAAIVSGKAFTA